MNDTILIDHYLNGNLSAEEKLLAEARSLVDDVFREKIEWQKKTHQLVTAYGRKQLKTEIQQVEQKLFTETRYSKFKNHIFQLFNL